MYIQVFQLSRVLFGWLIHVTVFFGFQVGIFAASVRRMRTICVTRVHFPCAGLALKILLSYVLEATKAFARLV